jgi:hypothetical protein
LPTPFRFNNSSDFLIFFFAVQPPLFATSDPPFLKRSLVSALIEQSVGFFFCLRLRLVSPFWNALRNCPARGQHLAVAAVVADPPGFCVY